MAERLATVYLVKPDVVRIPLEKGIHLDVSPTGGLLLHSPTLDNTITIGANKTSAIVSNHMGDVVFRDSRIVMNLNHPEEKRMIKFWEDGISFGLHQARPGYFIGEHGIQNEDIQDLYVHLVSAVFYSEDSYESLPKSQADNQVWLPYDEVDQGQDIDVRLLDLISTTSPTAKLKIGKHRICYYSTTPEKDLFTLNRSTFIVQDLHGTVKIYHYNLNNLRTLFLRTDPLNGSSTIATKRFYLDVSPGQQHLYIRQNISSKRLLYDGENLTVRYNGHETILDRSGKLSFTCYPLF